MKLKSKHDLVLVQLAVNKYMGGKQLLPQDYGLDEWPEKIDDGPDIRALFQSYDGKWRKFWHDFAQECHTFIGKESLPHPLRGVYAVPSQYWPELEAKLAKKREEFNEFVKQFLDIWDDLKAQQKALYGDKPWWPRIESTYPTKKTLEHKFGMNWWIFNITNPELNGMEAEVKAKVQEEYDAQVRAIAEMQIKYLRKLLVDKFALIQQRIAEGKMVQNQTLEAVRRAVSQYKALNVFGDSTLDQEMEKFLPTLATVDKELLEDNAPLMEKFAATVDLLAAQAADIKDIEVTVESYTRQVEM